MNAPIFVDTNVFIYALDTSEPKKQEKAAAWIDTLWEKTFGRTSFQVLHELYVNLTKKLSNPIEEVHARAVVRSLLAWEPKAPDSDALEKAWNLQDRFSLSWWDSLIVAAAHQQDCRQLLTEDLQHGQTFDGVLVVNPFRVDP